jgi:hypothetical protein
VAIVFIIIYPIGVPACFGALLLWNRDVLGGNMSGGQHADEWWYGDSETLDFLVDGYRAETVWFEEVEFLRKLLMAGARRTARCMSHVKMAGLQRFQIRIRITAERIGIGHIFCQPTRPNSV